MKHLIISSEYPPAPAGGIGTYVLHVSRVLAERGETVHVIGQSWAGAEEPVEVRINGRLVIHRIPYLDWRSVTRRAANPAIRCSRARILFDSDFPPQCFSWQAALLAEQLVEQEGIDLIEAQEYEAPLFYFQLRRALGFGPKSRPPCLVHLHSPTEFISRHNEWDPDLPEVLTAKRLEHYSIAAADAWVCPSRFLARQVESHLNLDRDSVKVIPYPVGETPYLDRNRETWEKGSICYVGRLERRKGVLEWIDAALALAPRYPSARFEFLGANVLGSNRISSAALLERRIPRSLRARFVFRGQQSRDSLPGFLVNARMVVVPSRWENFPNTCIEAMCSGLPVLASPEGGMAEMIEDGRTGWLASAQDSSALAQALRRALDTPPTKVADMGREAASAVRQMCDNEIIHRLHMDFRRDLGKRGASRSLLLPGSTPSSSGTEARGQRKRPEAQPAGGLGIVLICSRTGRAFEKCVQSIRNQNQSPAAVVVAHDLKEATRTLDSVRTSGWQLLHMERASFASAGNAGIRVLLSSEPGVIGVVVLRGTEVLEPHFVAECEAVLQRSPQVGLVSFWIRHRRRVWLRPSPGFPCPQHAVEVAPFSVIRTEALRAGGKDSEAIPGEEIRSLFNAVIARGWAAVTVPDVLGSLRTLTQRRLLGWGSARSAGSLRGSLLPFTRHILDTLRFILCNPGAMASILGDALREYRLSRKGGDETARSRHR